MVFLFFLFIPPFPKRIIWRNIPYILRNAVYILGNPATLTLFGRVGGCVRSTALRSAGVLLNGVAFLDKTDRETQLQMVSYAKRLSNTNVLCCVRTCTCWQENHGTTPGISVLIKSNQKSNQAHLQCKYLQILLIKQCVGVLSWDVHGRSCLATYPSLLPDHRIIYFVRYNDTQNKWVDNTHIRDMS